MTDRISEENGKLVVRLEGEIDLEQSPKVRGLLLESVARGKDLLVDLSEVTYLDSSGIASLVEAMQIAVRNGTSLKLFSASAQAMRVFELARLDKVFSIHPDLDTALAH